MADLEPPSFSLGFDLDHDAELQSAPKHEASTSNNFSEPAERSSGRPGLRSNDGGEEDDFETPPMGFGHPVSEPSSTLKRLRRGPSLAAQRQESKQKAKFILDDDIEEFSSQEDEPPDNALKHHYSVCSSSKFPLNGHGPHGVVMSLSAKQLSESKKEDVWNASASPDVEAISNNLDYHKLHVSPLRKFQLIDSDSDEASLCKGPNEVVNRLDMPSKDDQFTSGQVGTAGELKKRKEPAIIFQADDLWKEIHSDKSFHIPTPAFDEICEEYFRSAKDKSEFQKCDKGFHVSSNFKKNEAQQFVSDPAHPAHQYYFHQDSRIQMLVRARLPHFLPLSCGNNQGHKEHNATINYMSQFNQGEASKQGKKNNNIGSSSTRCRKNSRKSSVAESDNWINPRNSDKIAKAAGKGRVRGVSKSAGHWYTATDGRRVYVAGNGQELTGQIAYRQYKRDSGVGFKRSKKKAASKKVPARKKKK